MESSRSRVSSSELQLNDDVCYLVRSSDGTCRLILRDTWHNSEDDQLVSEEFAKAWVKEFGWDEDNDNYKPSNNEEEEEDDDDDDEDDDDEWS